MGNEVYRKIPDMAGSPHILHAYRVPAPDIHPTPPEIRLGGREGNLPILMEKSLGYRDLGDQTFGLILNKIRPYAPGPGLDNMIYIARENATINKITDLSDSQLARVFAFAADIHDVYQEASGPPIIREIIAINYHEDPITDEDLFGRKLYAQTLEDLHFHVVGLRRNDLSSIRPITPSDVTPQERDDVDDPMLPLVQRLVRNSHILEQLTNGITTFKLTDDNNPYNGINFTLSTGQTDEALGRDLKQLHNNSEALYNQLAGIFIDRNAPQDTIGMLHLRSSEEINVRIQNYLDSIDHGFQTDQDRYYVRRVLQALGSQMISGETAKEQGKPNTRIFLRNFAYTLSFIRDTKTGSVTVNLAPRIISSGNMLATLGYHKELTEPAPIEWIDARRRTEEMLIQQFKQSSNNS